jgi:hypothetical protein
LSVLKSVPVQPSIFDPDIELDYIPEEADKGLFTEGDVDEASESGLMVCPMPSR